ncbi:MAG TPA: DUF3576 domain-containing protein [Stellaceae bacterium]|nr:DUF3576 domain-containing protein [Stellaceae bacterium]
MSPGYYRLLFGLAASLSLILAGCGSDRPPETAADPVTGAVPAPPPASADNTDQTLWTILGLAKRASQQDNGPQTGAAVSPILWQATQDTLSFAGFASADPMLGLFLTHWYSPPGKPDERLQVSVFILSRALRSDSIAVSVKRQVRSPAGQWENTPVAREVVSGLESAILLRARQIHAEGYRNTMYK